MFQFRHLIISTLTTILQTVQLMLLLHFHSPFGCYFSDSNPAMKSIFLLVIFVMAACNLAMAEDNDDPLSDEFINQINEKATTWRVSQKQRVSFVLLL